MKQLQPIALSLSLVAPLAVAQPTVQNSNYWPVHRDIQAGFRISHPPGWIITPAKGSNVRFSINPPDGPGNCNVVARPNLEITGMSQAVLNREIESTPGDQASWAGLVGLPLSQVRVFESHHARITDVSALLGVIETKLENLEGKYTRKQTITIILTPGIVWSLNCGASSFDTGEASSRFTELQTTFNKILGSFIFLK